MSTLTDSASEVISENVNILFAEDENPQGATADLQNRAKAFFNLSELFCGSNTELCYLNQHMRINRDALVLMLRRFQRDAYGVYRLKQHLDAQVTAGNISSPLSDNILQRVTTLGVRIATPAPKKTRVAAAFSLWMCALRPVYVFANEGVPGVESAPRTQFCAALNIWITSMFLGKYGTVVIGNHATSAEVRKRILHDFTFRDINLSSLELFYCSIFRARDGASAL